MEVRFYKSLLFHGLGQAYVIISTEKAHNASKIETFVLLKTSNGSIIAKGQKISLDDESALAIHDLFGFGREGAEGLMRQEILPGYYDALQQQGGYSVNTALTEEKAGLGLLITLALKDKVLMNKISNNTQSQPLKDLINKAIILSTSVKTEPLDIFVGE